MSVLEYIEKEKIMVVSHRKFIEDIYGKLPHWKEQLDLFDIKTPFRMDQQAEKVAKMLESGETACCTSRKKKRKHKEEYHFQSEVDFIRERQSVFANLREIHFPGSPSLEDIRDNNRTVREKVRSLMQRLSSKEMPESGVNSTTEVVESHGMIYPGLASFIRCDVSVLEEQVREMVDLVVLDPPWENKHVKRVKSVSGYSMMSDTVLSCIPIEKLVRPGGLVLVWCTNSKRHRTNLTVCFSTWGVSLEATWYWVKLTRFGELVTDFSSDCGKQPYEVVLVGRRKGGEGEVSQAASIQIPDGLVIYSVPSGIHSHKPPLHDVLTRLVKPQKELEEENAEHGRRVIEDLAKLEVFGRSLVPGWMTIGLQPCLFNITDNLSCEENTIAV